MFTGLSHVNVTVPEGTLELANDFYGNTIGLTPRPVPHLQRETLAWYVTLTDSPQEHAAYLWMQGLISVPRHSSSMSHLAQTLISKPRATSVSG